MPGGGGGARPAAKKGGAKSAGAVMRESSAPSASKLKHWFRKQRRKHMASLTPAEQERMKQNVLRQNREQRKHRLGRKAKKIAYASASARSSVMSSIASYSPALQQNRSAKEKQATRESASRTLESVQLLQSARLSESESEDDIAMMDEEGEAAAAGLDEKEVKSLLDELRVEPADDAERATKFQIYEQ